VLREREDTAAALTRSNALHAAVLASLQDQIAVLDQDGNIIEANDSWKHATQRLLRTDEQPGQNYLAVVTRAANFGDETSAAISDALREVLSGSTERRELEFSLSQHDGTHWFEESIESLRRSERGAVVTLSDVTARKRAEIEVQEQQQQLAHLTRAAIVGEFSGALAHEIKQPLAAILGNAEAAAMLLSEEDEAVESIREILNDIIADDLRAAQVIDRLPSMLSNADAQRGPLALNQLVQESLVLARSDLTRQRVSVTTDFASDLPSASGDRVLIQQVLLNLISNACDAMADMPADSRRLALTTRHLKKLQRVEVAVRDYGHGIADDLRERIFQPFVTTKPNGLGLGLSICRSIIDAHGGRLWAVQASPGAALHFVLPIQP
jgi:C4-dicarboxylate-specific signal transduction histidine kinase